ncbi:hypothetical protein C6W96_04075 [Streptomyces sp. CS149]|uniref:LysR family transcriptional regulator n=1 Tax=Streptomyces sp. CS149 TaxID=2109332 RepID=UPI000D1A5E51|nr:LysR family transcriptional regulator [Streptomyces sp. CS149]PSK74044.1 hypothetical protein C6W96_04075 [Streptomyces sp. CS149]
MEVRELRYFVAVAEELHFGRAAERLGIAQPALSRALAGLERRLGVVLLERSSHRVRLTDAGAALLTEARAILAAAEAGELLAEVLDAYAAHPGACAVDLLLCEAHEQRELLCSGRADVALLHLPFDAVAGLDTEALLTEGQVVVLPASAAVDLRRDLVAVPVTDAPPVTTVLAWLPESRSRPVAGLVRVAATA